eukprot:gene2310-15447_t
MHARVADAPPAGAPAPPAPGGETFCEGRVVVWSDGASRDNQSPELRRAGVGAYWARGHPRNVCEPLRGDDQTNNRAEATAVIRILEREPRRVEIRTDSRYVLDGLAHRAERRERRWAQVANADLWQETDALLEARAAGDVRFTKVKAHSTETDVAAGRVSALDLKVLLTLAAAARPPAHLSAEVKKTGDRAAWKGAAGWQDSCWGGKLMPRYDEEERATRARRWT